MTGEVMLRRRYRFEAAHRLVSDRLSDDENERVFGKCCRPGGHGHNYEVELTLRGTPDPDSGLLISREELDGIVSVRLLSRADHRNLNDVVTGEVTTGENLARTFFEWLAPALPPSARLVRLRLRETEKNVFDVIPKGMR